MAVFLAALGARALHWHEARHEPLFNYLISDARAYWAWSQAIVGGDPLSRGQGIFYQAPLYPYFLALARALAGESLGAVRGVQAVLGSLGCALLAWAGMRLHSRTAGAVAGFGLPLPASVAQAESRSMVKLLVERDGVVRVTDGDLAKAGFEVRKLRSTGSACRFAARRSRSSCGAPPAAPTASS